MHAPMRLARGVLVWTLLAESAAAQPSTVTPSSAGGRVSGRVISSYAGLIADATITLTHLSATGAGIEAQTTTSDRQGAFGFEPVAAGRYHLVASKPGYTNRQLPSFGSANVTAGFATGTGFTLSANEHAAGLELTLRHAASIAGRIAEPDGIPAPEVHVLAAVRRGDSYVTLPETRTTTAWDGRYDITGLPPGEYLVVVMPLPSLDQGRVLASAERRAPEAPVSTRPSFGATLYPGVPDTERGDSVTVFEGIAAEGIDVWLTPAQRYSVSGRVFWPDGLAAENIAIEYSDATTHRSGLWVVSDPGGLFTIHGVPAGTLMLLARADSNQGPLAGMVSTDVSVSAVEDLRLTLIKPGTVEGRVVYDADVPAAARPGAIALRQTLVRVSALYPVPESPLGPDGRFQIRNAFGEYTFELRGLPTGMRIKNVSRSGRPLPGGRIGILGGDTITGVEVVVGH